ncbi:MAG: hypothetical protein K2X77_11925 [Candidatus Obscuribacterales bacterium]|jgi:hypothetical protein|nr:hypothetical protein [Candidatus Obscuribacterales bacterium]
MTKIVTQIPLYELSSENGSTVSRGRNLSAGDIADLLRADRVELAVADCGMPLKRISKDGIFNFWKSDAKKRIVAPTQEKIIPEQYPSGYCYVASEWLSEDETTLVLLLEKYH